jgi:hypothetical protein
MFKSFLNLIDQLFIKDLVLGKRVKNEILGTRDLITMEETESLSNQEILNALVLEM